MYEQAIRTMPRNDDEGPHAATRPLGPHGVVAEALNKRYPDVWAVRDLDLAVPRGSVLGLLGHNGAGKTTVIRMLTTLTAPTSGRAAVAGYDVAAQPREVRRRIGVTAQDVTVDGMMSARLNLELVARLNRLPKAQARQRADELLGQLGLAGDADRLAKTFSGGMRRRLDLAASLVASPEVLFLDEPTTGLDPRSREGLWQMLRDLVRGGTTIVLTTQYLEEADRLADHVVVLDHGRSVAAGSPAALKSRLGDERIEVALASVDDLAAAADVLSSLAGGAVASDPDERTVSVPVSGGARPLDVLRALDARHVEVVDLLRRRPTLDDVFLTLTAPSEARR